MTEEFDTSWFDLRKYDAVEGFDISDWYFQLEKRQTIQLFAKENQDLMDRVHISRWKVINNNTKKYIASIKENPVLDVSKYKRTIQSVRDTNFFDLHMAASGNEEIKKLINSPDDSFDFNKSDSLIISRPKSSVYMNRAMLTIDLSATDEQLTNDFNDWLKSHRLTTNSRVREKRFSSKDFSKWINFRILPYLDLTLIADAEDKTLTQNMLGRILFPDEYNVDLTERIRRSVKPIAEQLLEKKVLESLHIQAKAT